MLLVFVVLLSLGSCSCWVASDPSDHVVARCPLHECLSTEYASRTGLAHVCSQSPGLPCLTLLLIDGATVRRLGYAIEEATVIVSETVLGDAMRAAPLAGHLDFGWLPRVSKQEFVRLFAWAATRARSYGSDGGKVILPIGMDGEVEFDSASDTFVVTRSQQ